MATACTDSNFGNQKKEDGVNNNEEESQDIQGTDPNLGYQKKQGVNNNSKGEKIGDGNFEEIPELAHHYLACGSESEDSENSENSDDQETVSGSSETSSDSKDMVENNNEELLNVVEGLIKDLCDISYKNKVRNIINSMLDKDLGETPLPTNVMNEVEELLRHPDVDVQSKIIEIKHVPIRFHIEETENMADVWDEFDSEEIDDIVGQMPDLGDWGDDNHAIVFQGTLLHQAVSTCSFEVVKVLWPHFKDPNPDAEPGTPDEYMTPLNIAASEGQKDVYDFLIGKISEKNLEEIPQLAHHCPVHCLDSDCI